MYIQKARQSGLTPLITKGEGYAKELSLLRLQLEPGTQETMSFEREEATLVLLNGNVTFSWNGENRQAKRESPFKERASALYLPAGAEATVLADVDSELIIATTACDATGAPALVGPEDVTVNKRGKQGYAREVHDIFINDPHAKRLLVGETFNPPGSWSSFPPHKHDGEDGEPYLEEVYYYRLDPPQGFAYQGLYAKDGSLNEAYTVKDGDAVLISRGFHPVGAAPGYSLCYFWVLAGEQRKLALFEDPDHVWLHDA
jgi:5-deoxy-glucuronate isomerase